MRLVFLLELLLTHSYWPAGLRPTLLGSTCSPFDLTCPLHDGLYPLIRFGAAAIWQLNRVLLLVAYQLDIARAWVVDTALAGAFSLVVGHVELPLRGMLLLALWVFGICYFLTPFFSLRLVDLRRLLAYLLVASLLVQSGGTWLSGVERLRSSLGSALLTSTQSLGGAPLVAARDGELSAMDQPLYDGTANAICAAPTLARRPDGQRHADDLAARFLFADAVDLHCPGRRGPADDLPDGFVDDGRYFVNGGLAELSEAERHARMALGYQGIVRQAQGIVPSLAAVLEMATNLLFALAMAAAWISIPIALLFAFFLHTEGIFAALVRRLVQILVQSWTVSVLLGLALSLLMTAADAGSIGGYLAAALLCVGLLIVFTLAALRTLMSALDTAAISIGQVSGMSLPRPSTPLVAAGALAMRQLSPASKSQPSASSVSPPPQHASRRPTASSLLQHGPSLRAGQIAEAMAADTRLAASTPQQ